MFRGHRGAQPARNRSIARSWSTLRRLRRLSQIIFLGLFVLLLYRTEYRSAFRSDALEYRLPPAVRIFLETDPFLAVANALSTHALYRGLLWSLAIIVPTLFLGRFFCGWICPLGTMNHAVGNVRSEKKSGRRRIESNRYKGWQETKYYLMFALLAAALLGSALAGIFDPIAFTVRSFALSVLPAWNYALGHSAPVGVLLSAKDAHFRQAFVLGVIFVVVLALNLRVTRFWCRALCPLGALLGLASRWSVLGLEKNPESCGDCNLCLLHCQGGDDPLPGVPWRKTECHLCMNCVAECPERGLQFRFFPRTVERVDLKRRKVLTGLAAGAAALPLLRANTGLEVETHERLIRPPGALDEGSFLARCIRCGECMKVCPNNALQPALSEAGWEGLWTPVLAPRIGYCEPSCTLCGQVCPTGAIWEFTSAEKAWAAAPAATGEARPIRLGTAFYDRGRCLPWALATDCIVCEEWCPTSPKAVYLRVAEVIDANGEVKQVRQPYIDAEHCVGCGACEFACPVRDRPAVYVTSVGESRSKANQILLKPSPKSAGWLPESGEAAGWTRERDVRIFEAADLWKYIDGDAERFLRAGVRRALTAGYRYQQTIEAAADVFMMQSPEGAASIFESQPSAGSRPAALGEAGRSFGQSLTFRRGPFFVRLVAYQNLPQTEAALASLGRAIESRLTH